MKIGFCSVCADILHEGHIRFLKFAKQHCDYLIVGVMNDLAIFHYKKRFPIVNQEERALIVSSLKAVDKVIFQYSYYEINQIIDNHDINVFIESDTHDRSVHGNCVKVLAPYYRYQDSSQIKDKICRRWKKS